MIIYNEIVNVKDGCFGVGKLEREGVTLMLSLL